MEKIIKAMEYTDNGMKKTIREIEKQYDFLETFSIGQSVMGREIPALKIGSGEYCLFTAGFSGTERLTTNILLFFAEELCRCIKENIPFAGINVNKALSGRGIIIVPRVNVDGAEIALCGASAAGSLAKEIRRISGNNTENWRANLRGVEINRNFSSGWYTLRETQRAAGVFAPCMSGYGGPYPESEPETVALLKLCERFKFKYSLSFLQGDSVIYWQYGDKLPQKSEKMVSIMASCSGYRFDPVGSNSPGGSFKDCFINSYERPAFNVHIKNTDIYTCDEEYLVLRKMLLVSTLF